jgi:hypothetical protein
MGNPWDYDFSAIGRAAADLLIVHGSDRDASVKTSGTGFRIGGNSDIYQLLPETVRVHQVNMSKQFATARRPDPKHYPVVLNLCSDPDQHPKSLERIHKLLRGYKGRVVNKPEMVLRTTRDQVARRLAGIDGLRVPKIVRLRHPKPGVAVAASQKAGQSFPLIVRRAGTHTGRIIGVVANADELEAAATGEGDFFLIEFADFQSDDGLYRKYRLWSLGGTTIFRHLVITDNWNVHVSERMRFMLDRPALMAEEKRHLERPDGAFPPSVHATFDAVKKRMGLDYFGMDFAIGRDGGIILFEANATMNFFPLEPHLKFSYLGQIRGPAMQAFTAMLGLAK